MLTSDCCLTEQTQGGNPRTPFTPYFKSSTSARHPHGNKLSLNAGLQRTRLRCRRSIRSVGPYGQNAPQLSHPAQTGGTLSKWQYGHSHRLGGTSPFHDWAGSTVKHSWQLGHSYAAHVSSPWHRGQWIVCSARTGDANPTTSRASRMSASLRLMVSPLSRPVSSRSAGRA